MVLSYMEEIISKYYKVKGYIVSHHVIYKSPDPKTAALKDINILAIGKKDIVIIACRPYMGHVEAKPLLKPIIRDFNFAEESIKDIPRIKDKIITKMIITEEPLKEADKELEKNGINVYKLEDLMMDFLILLLKKHKGKRLENTASDMIRNLIFLILEERA